MKEVTRRQNALFMSIAVHLIIIVIFTLLRIDFHPVDSSFIEVDLAKRGSQSAKEMPIFSKSSNAGTRPENSINNKNDVQLPSRRLIVEKEESIFEDIDKVDTENDSLNFAQETLENNNTDNYLSRIATDSRDQEMKVAVTGDKAFIPGTPEVMSENGSGKSGIYEINWEKGFKREVVHRVIPEFPEGVDRSTKIILKFSVNTKGEVASIIPLQKGDPKIENIAIKSFSDWRFNPIAGETIQWGKITFNFMIR